MERNRSSYQRRPRNRDSLERQMDQWMETGRQFVDGVAGNRPGQRRKDNNRSRLNNMGRWVEDKMDWFFEEEEDEEDWSNTQRPSTLKLADSLPTRKRPLSAISLRVPKALTASSSENNKSNGNYEWPDDSSFKVDRWKRDHDQVKEINKSLDVPDFSEEKMVNRRPLPRSSRRRV